MEIVATTRNVRISPRKVRLIVEGIKHLPIEGAISALGVLNKRGAREIAKTIQSARSNAVNNAHLESKNLVMSTITVSEGSSLKRYHPSTRGRIHPYKKRSSHIRVILKTKDEGNKGVKNGTKS